MHDDSIKPTTSVHKMSVELHESPPLAPRIAALLQGLRLRIRGYVWIEGLAWLVVVLGLAFWASLAFDWSFEPPWQFRCLMLAATAVAAAIRCAAIYRTKSISTAG